MRNINEDTITQAVLAAMFECRDDRLRVVMTSLVQHLHSFAREVKLSEAEWFEGIRFLTEAGHITDDKRQEFILLSDVLGLSMLVTAQNNAKPDGCTESTVFGPFFVEGAPLVDNGADIANGAKGPPCVVRGQVRGLEQLSPGRSEDSCAPPRGAGAVPGDRGPTYTQLSPGRSEDSCAPPRGAGAVLGDRGPTCNGQPIAGAVINVWQSDEDGFYDVQMPIGPGQHEHRARAQLRSAQDGRFHFRSVLPQHYPIPHDGPVGAMLEALGRHPWRPAHLHFMIEAPGYERLITHVFRDGDKYLDSDAVFGVRSSLIADWVRHEPDGSSAQPYYTLDFDFVLNPIEDVR